MFLLLILICACQRNIIMTHLRESRVCTHSPHKRGEIREWKKLPRNIFKLAAFACFQHSCPVYRPSLGQHKCLHSALPVTYCWWQWTKIWFLRQLWKFLISVFNSLYSNNTQKISSSSSCIVVCISAFCIAEALRWPVSNLLCPSLAPALNICFESIKM